MTVRANTIGMVILAMVLIGILSVVAMYLAVDDATWSTVWPLPVLPITTGAILFAAIFVPLLLRMRFEPWRKAADEAAAIERSDQRMRVPSGPVELKQLVRTLNHMLERLETASQRERAFLGTASHELRRPLAALQMEIELALQGERDATELRNAFELCLTDTEAMTRLVDDLLFHARSRAGALRLREDEVDMIDLVFASVDRAQRAMSGQPSIQVHVEAIPKIHIRADRAGLGQVFENLIVNARTHGGREATIEIGGEVNGQYISVWVQDDGPGVSEAEQARIFETFGRGDRTRSVSGSGLGLAIARDLVLAHAGVIEILSPVKPDDEGQLGSRFTVRLPISRRIQSRVDDDADDSSPVL